MSSDTPTDPGTPEAKRPQLTGEYLDSLHPSQARLIEWACLQQGEQNPDKYWDIVCPELKGDPHNISWCGGYALAGWVLNLPGCKDWTWTPRKGFLFKHDVKTVAIPETGDIAVWEKLNGKTIWHYAIVEDFRDGKVITIDGNQGIAPEERVARRTRGLDTNPVFYSCKPYL